MAIAKVPGGDLYYEELGDGFPIRLIHPAGATASTWGSVPEELARAGRVVVYDRRGIAAPHGRHHAIAGQRDPWRQRARG